MYDIATDGTRFFYITKNGPNFVVGAPLNISDSNIDKLQAAHSEEALFFTFTSPTLTAQMIKAQTVIQASPLVCLAGYFIENSACVFVCTAPNVVGLDGLTCVAKCSGQNEFADSLAEVVNGFC